MPLRLHDALARNREIHFRRWLNRWRFSERPRAARARDPIRRPEQKNFPNLRRSRRTNRRRRKALGRSFFSSPEAAQRLPNFRSFPPVCSPNLQSQN